MLHLCLIFDLALFDTAPLDAAQALGSAARLGAQLQDDRQGRRLSLRGSGSPGDGFGALTAATGAALDLGPCPDADRVVEISNHPRGLGEPWMPGVLDTGLSALEDVERRVREVMDIPIPRRMPPFDIPGFVIAVPEGHPAGLGAVYADPLADWLWLGEVLVLHLSDWEVLRTVETDTGAEVLLKDVPQSALSLGAAGPQAVVHGGAMGLYKGGDGTPWPKARRTRH